MRDPHDPYNTLTPMQHRMITVIHNLGDWADTQHVAEQVGITVSHTNRVLNNLYDGGNVERRRSPRPNHGIRAHQWKCTHQP